MSLTFSGGNDGTFTPGVGAIDTVQPSDTPADPVIGVLTLKARLVVTVGRPVKPQLTELAGMSVSLVMPPTAIHGGKAHVPKLWAKLSIGGRAQSGPGHLRGFADPDPVWVGGLWTTPPPAPKNGGHFMRWTARQLPNPSGFANSRYLLGAPSSSDGTTGITSGARAWNSDPGSDFAVPWNSAYPFKPTVMAHVHYGPDGSMRTETAGIHFTSGVIEHMWADFGTILNQPFTMLVVAVLTDFPARDSFTFVTDSGQDQTANLTDGQKLAIYRRQMTAGINVSENLGYRNGLRVSRKNLQVFNDQTPTTRVLRVPFTHTFKPKVLAMVVNGGNSWVYERDHQRRHSHRATLASHGAQRLWVLGRANGRIDEDYASNMVVFEVRAWDSALDVDDLDTQYEQLSSTWKFHEYA